MLSVGCPYIAKPPPSIVAISAAAIIALSVVGSLLFIGFVCGGWYYRRNRIKHQIEMKILAEENEKKVRTYHFSCTC
jgi:hypothetical protein